MPHSVSPARPTRLIPTDTSTPLSRNESSNALNNPSSAADNALAANGPRSVKANMAAPLASGISSSQAGRTAAAPSSNNRIHPTSSHPAASSSTQSADDRASDAAILLDTTFTASTSQECLDAAYALTALVIQSASLRGLDDYGLLARVRSAAADKKNGSARESAMILLGALFERLPPRLPLSEIVFLRRTTPADGGQPGSLVALALDALADKGAVVRESAQYALVALFNNLGPEARVIGMLPVLISYLSKRTGKWQGTVGAYALLEKMADAAKLGSGTKEEERHKDILRAAMGKRLAALIPIVESGMHDLKAEVSKQAVKSMNALTTLLQNDDVASRIPLLITSMQHPSAETLQKAILALSQTTFVAEVTSPVLALLTPLLERALNNPSTPQEVLRQAVVVVENLTRLVHDPVEARTFLPKLRPGVQGVKDRASLPEVRELATRALDVVHKAMGEDSAATTTSQGDIPPLSLEDIEQLLQSSTQKAGGVSDPTLWALTVPYLAAMLREDIAVRDIPRTKDVLSPYMQEITSEDVGAQIADVAYHHFLQDDHRRFGQPAAADPGEVEIVNADFSLGYGGMLLLSHTNLRLLKGHRYGLCGRNGAGKSTLMRSIAEGKLEGFPSPEELRTCFVEHNQGEDADLSILDFCLQDPKIAPEGRERTSQVLSEFGFSAGPEGLQSQKVGTLSGGWKMKLSIARAMLQRAQVLLCDEPTNHLDAANIKWLEDYLTSHHEVTSLIVSHDSSFLDNVCTDIYHYEQKKLVCYPGNLAEFVKKKPEAKTYYTLSAAQSQMKFSAPGLLAGVKSNTRAIIRMTNCTYTYPGASKPSLSDVSCALSLSSRTAIIGGNGAGKSTLLKLLTGETVPQRGRVEKHPNLRIGYIKQHALEHVEMHLEKTPNQYLQWRYARGDDREVLLKQTRQLSEEDRAQMEKAIDLGDGKGPRVIEALMGRQKWKKSFQYEVKWRAWLPKHNSQLSRETLLEHGFSKLVQEFDDHESSREGLSYRELQPKVIAQHFADIGLDPEIANHTPISGLSGGQKVRVTLAGALWNNPHLLVLDEPTNFLDREALGGLAVAIRDFRGGVLMVSHNDEFVGALCPEQWHVVDGRVAHRGHLAVALDRFEDSGSGPGSGAGSSAVPSRAVTPSGGRSASGTPAAGSTPAASAAVSTVNSEDERADELKFKAAKKKKKTKRQIKEQEARRRLRHIEWLNSPKGTPRPPDTDDEAE